MARIRFFLLMMLVLQITGTVKVFSQNIIINELKISGISVDSTYHLSPWTLPESIQVFANDTLIDSTYWRFEKLTGAWSLTPKFRNKYRSVSSIQIEYKAFPLTLPRIYQPRKPHEVDTSYFSNPDSLHKKLTDGRNKQRLNPLNLRQSGSLSRGIIVGSNQDFSLESGLNFELNGALTENINIHASLTDQSIPIQPDGTTQNLREFDKVFIQLEAPHAALEMGDVDISLSQSTFAQLNRRLQGATGNINSAHGSYTGVASAVRGTYKSMHFSGKDGVQGPYRLTGRNDRAFVIVLAGTEKVYINGQRVQRGAENEYIIDYGLGEVTFTNNLLVKDETRIIIEYEYIEQDFNRTLVAAEGRGDLMDGRLKMGATVIRQADGDDLLSQQSLSRSDIEILQQAGDNLEGAVVSGARIATEEERDQFVLYAKVDTMWNGQVYSIYEHQPNSGQSIYRVQFSKVAQGEGSYKRASGAVNGLLYKWAGPGKGDYEPSRQLPAPQKKQMVAINGRYQLSKGVEIFGEWAASDFDANRFSSLDDDDNTDMAYTSGLKLEGISSGIGKIDATLSRRFSGRRFTFFERTRDVEFDRKWNITRNAQSREAINQAAIQIHPTEQTMVGGELGLVERDRFSGVRQASSFKSSEAGMVDVNYTQDWVQSEDQVLQQKGNWFRQHGNLSKAFDAGTVNITPYAAFEQENRNQRNTVTDSLSSLSQRFYDIGPGLKIGFNHLKLDASLAYRKEEGVLDNKLQKEATAFEQRYKISYRPAHFFSTVNEVKWRDKKYTKAFEAAGNTERKGLLIKSVTNYAVKKTLLQGEFFYEANTESRALLQETYIEVGPEMGQYVWDDLNGDGIQQVDEFFLEVSPNEGTFVRQFLPSDELLPVINLNARWLNTFKPFMVSDSWLSGISLRSRIDITENSTTQNIRDVYLLKLHTFRNDSTTIKGRLHWEQEMNLLGGINKADLRVGYMQNRSLNRRSTESIAQFTNLARLNSSYQLSERTRISLGAQTGINKSESSRLVNRNFDIKTLKLTPGINGTVNRSWNAGVEVSLIHREDRFPTQKVTANLLKIATTHRTYLWEKLQANFRVEMRRTQVSGNSTSYGNYELTEGTGEGTNLIWSLNSSYRVSRLIRISFNYDGRTVANRPSIHTIKLVMSATF